MKKEYKISNKQSVIIDHYLIDGKLAFISMHKNNTCDGICYCFNIVHKHILNNVMHYKKNISFGENIRYWQK